MSHTVAELYARIVVDPWRAQAGFSPEMAEANDRLFAAGDDTETIAAILSTWLKAHQPCVFGRLAAKLDLLSFCILTAADLCSSDEAIRDKIQEARCVWLAKGHKGHKSGFILLAAAPVLTQALPDENLRALAQRIGFLYLLQEPTVDAVYQDEIFLEEVGAQGKAWKWLAGVNYFCANADGRWWQDHRIPGGLAFSVNSVGHLVKSKLLTKSTSELEQLLGTPPGQPHKHALDSLGKALVIAMNTIGMAANTPSGKATSLIPLAAGPLPRPTCPVALPASLTDKEFRFYHGYYHTDYTLPAEYFRPDVERPINCRPWTLDLTYLFDSGVDNPDYITMAAGRRIRGESPKTARMEPVLVSIEQNPRLIEALKATEKTP